MGDGWREREIGERGESEKTHSHSVGIFINRKFRAKVLPLSVQGKAVSLGSQYSGTSKGIF